MFVRRLAAGLFVALTTLAAGCAHHGCCGGRTTAARPCCPPGAYTPPPLPAAPAPVISGFAPANGCCR